ncbi:MAG: hypothetical protein LQ347_006124 [Umbilicaria vellea]|nr:MAG: hypothetical protein LQ347_006124 [Umbilicaria vellea]
MARSMSHIQVLQGYAPVRNMAGNWEDNINITHMVKENNMGRQSKQSVKLCAPGACADH